MARHAALTFARREAPDGEGKRGSRAALVLPAAARLPLGGEPDFQAARAPTRAGLADLLERIIARLMNMLTRRGDLVAEQGMTCLADLDADDPLRSSQAASCTDRIALGPRAARRLLSLRAVRGQDEKTTPALCADAHGFSLHAGVRCGAHQRKELERLCRYVARPAIANQRLRRNDAGDVVLQLKSARRDGGTHIVMSPLEFMQRLAALVPRPRRHLIRFHGALAPNAGPRSCRVGRANPVNPPRSTPPQRRA